MKRKQEPLLYRDYVEVYVQVCRKVWSKAQLSRPNGGGGRGGGAPVVSQIFLKLPVPSFSELSSPDSWAVVPASLGFWEVLAC